MFFDYLNDLCLSLYVSIKYYVTVSKEANYEPTFYD